MLSQLNHRITSQQKFTNKVGKAVGKVTSMQKQSMRDLSSRLDNLVVDGDDEYLQLCIEILTFKTDFEMVEPVGENNQPHPGCVSEIPTGGKSQKWDYKSLTISCTTNQKNILGTDELKYLGTNEVFDFVDEFISIINLLFHSNLVCIQVPTFYKNHDQPLCFFNMDQSCSLTIKKFDEFKFEIIASNPNCRSVASYIEKTFKGKSIQSKQSIISGMMERQGRLFFDLLTFVCCLVR